MARKQNKNAKKMIVAIQIIARGSEGHWKSFEMHHDYDK